MPSRLEIEFRRQWPACLASIRKVYGELMPLPNGRYERAAEQLERLDAKSAPNEIEKAVRALWNFDGRFCGDVLGFGSECYEWAVYSLCYLCHDEAMIEHLLNIYLPLLGRYLNDRLGSDFNNKVGLTFMDDVGDLLWERQGLIEPEDHGLFDWHGNRNDLPCERIASFLERADLPPLPHADFPPRWVLLHFANLQDPFESEEDYLRDLAEFYGDRGYRIPLL